jgi:hypothetical protein
VTKRERLRERIRRRRALAAERKEMRRKEREGIVTTSVISKQ